MPTSEKMAKGKLVKAIGTVALLSVASKLLGFFREASLAAVFGATSETDAYLVASGIPALLFAAVSYALTTTFIPTYAKVVAEEGQDVAFRVANSIINIALIAASTLALLGMLNATPLVGLVAPGFAVPVRELTVELTMIMLPIVIFSSVSGLLTGMLQSHGKFSVPAAVDVLHNLLWIGSITILGSLYGIQAVAVGTVIAMIMVVVLKLPALRGLGFRWQLVVDLRAPAIRKLAWLIVPAIIGAGVGELNIFVDRLLASGLPEGRIAALNYATRLMQIAPSILGTSIATVIYPTLARVSVERKWKDFTQTLARALGLVQFFMTPIAVGTAVLALPLVRIVFERGVFDIDASLTTARALLFSTPVILFGSMRDLLARAFFAMSDTTTPMLLGFATVGANVLFNLLLIGPLEHAGLALGTSLASLVGLLLTVWALQRKMPGELPLRTLFSSGLRSILASGLMAGVLVSGQPYLNNWISGADTVVELTRFAVSGVLGILIYVVVVRLLNVPEYHIVYALLRRGVGTLVNKYSKQDEVT